MKRIKKTDTKLLVLGMAEKQKYRCPLCNADLTKIEHKDWVLDHDHATGDLRSVLCRNCNGMEGKVRHYANRAKRDSTVELWLSRLLAYYDHHAKKPSGIKHYTWKSPEEARLERNKKARLARARKKAIENLKS